MSQQVDPEVVRFLHILAQLANHHPKFERYIDKFARTFLIEHCKEGIESYGDEEQFADYFATSPQVNTAPPDQYEVDRFADDVNSVTQVYPQFVRRIALWFYEIGKILYPRCDDPKCLFCSCKDAEEYADIAEAAAKELTRVTAQDKMRSNAHNN
jgi:hypothetical protein